MSAELKSPGLMGSALMGTGMGEQKVLWGRPEPLTHGRPDSLTDSRDSSGTPHRKPAVRARAARYGSAATAGGVA